MDLKYDILKHPNVAGTTDGKAGPYFHGEVTSAVAAIEYLDIDLAGLDSDEETTGNFELLSEDELEKLFENEED